MRRHKQFDLIPGKATVNIIYEDGTVGHEGKVSGVNLHYMLWDFTYVEESGLWHSDKGRDGAYQVLPLND
ncbi:hypothetical protein FACS1894208_12870 [Clostridia bacterium]|nr:hypothetical protein FACS1894208_12870 [Clostridia bacterium]